MTTRRFALMALCLVCLPACRTAPLLNPDPFSAAATPQKTEKAIDQALAGRGWLISSKEPGKINATLNSRGHVARIVVTYDDKNVTIRYVNSEDLHYGIGKDGRPVIHKNYNAWINYLMQDINRNIVLSE